MPIADDDEIEFEIEEVLEEALFLVDSQSNDDQQLDKSDSLSNFEDSNEEIHPFRQPIFELE